MDIHLYMLCYRFEALVASHLEPEAFGRYMAIGTRKNTQGNVLFFEVDPQLKSSYFRLSDIVDRCLPLPDGSPKRSKYISSYRVLEHLEPSVLGKLYLTTADGRTLGLEPGSYDMSQEKPGIHLFDELCPVSPLVVSILPPGAFAKFMTSPENPVHGPRIFFGDMLLDRDESGHLAGYLPYQHPLHILDCIRELEQVAGSKPTKTISRTPRIHGFFRTVGSGFFVGDQRTIKFYPFPQRRELELEHSRWWRSASESLIS